MSKLPTSYTGRSTVNSGAREPVFTDDVPDRAETLEQRIAAGKLGPAASHPDKPFHEKLLFITDRYSAFYLAKGTENNLYLLIVPARNADEAVTGSGILAIGKNEKDVIEKAYAIAYNDRL